MSNADVVEHSFMTMFYYIHKNEAPRLRMNHLKMFSIFFLILNYKGLYIKTSFFLTQVN
jgi:hypothetical protein